MSEEHPVLKPKKRNSADAESVADTPAPRSKRGKYTSVACDDCKKKKLKCIPSEDNTCERCIAGGLTCTFATSTQATKEKPDDNQNIQALNHQLSELRQQMSDLVGVVRELKDQNQSQHQTHPQDASTVSSHNVVTHSPASTHRGEMPKQPQFVGPTRSAFGILVSERSLNRMGVPKFDSMPPSGAQSPIEPALDSINDLSFWHCCTASDITKYLVNFQEEVESVYPFIDIAEYIAQSKEILQAIRGGGLGFEDEGKVSSKDIDIAKVAISTGILLEEPSKLELATAIVDSVQTNVSSILSPQVDLKEVQLLAMLSIYYFHAGEELLAWRSIGIAARQALEMGLHRKRSLLDNFKDTDSRRLATRVFWCVYVLDRRWSFGTSLSFALVDKDVDPELPKPDEEYLYLQCMVGYGQLCSKIWEAIPPFGSASQTIPDDTAAILDLKTQDWLDSIPPHLRLRHPRLGLAPRAQPRLPHRLRALLYLRGNYARILIYRHHLMSTASIAANPQNAWLVVDIAQDTIQVLVHLHATTDIYKRQQNVFNYFLLSALAVIFLAVCHAPEIFSVPCKRTFSDGVELVRGLSRHNIVSKRLWKSIRGMIPRMNTFSFPQNGEDGETRKDDENGQNGATTDQGVPQVEVNAEEQVPMAMPENEAFSFGDMMFGDVEMANSVPDMFQMSESLLNLFNAFGEGQQFLNPVPSTFSDEGEYTMAAEQGKDISMRFQGLI
ncbi:hypothetical protein DER46DRAFT_118432 [Fusarium sp. MPI-SDFR-AT-0072]|uniref:Putative transcriptional regulatory protein n=1 Tax=Fusarium oxysporum f. sp. rapae TaxID=485398 RepID=A0A8J5P320_FUSOX|nr:putative transcriptional regulatory protein [Fusarium oxysporum f. sp. rapae]KAH7177268.1 hypothetical protein DER46DRAFT_118432 [Fusarium sp. MPI-SDFR-AT-0072]KAI7764251.1 hypothetical protein LZL87_012660 [Fusarium oxysporum]